MKKIISGIMSAVLFTALAVGNCVSAESVTAESNVSMTGNKCGKLIVESNIERTVHVVIEQVTKEGNYGYYDTVIPVSEDGISYDFALEGKDDVSYTISIGVPKYKSAGSLQMFEDEFYIYDTDEIEAQDVSGYEYTYVINKSETDELTSEKITDNVKDENNIVKCLTNLYFPTADYMAGDSNSDGAVNIRDAAFIARKLAEQNAIDIPDWGDYNGDIAINIRDAAAIARDLSIKQP